MKTLFRLSLLLSLCFVFIIPNVYCAELETAIPEEAGMSSERLSRIDNLLQGIVDKKTAKGAVAAVARHGKLVYLKAFGDMDEGKPMQKNTIFRICSQTKLVTSVAVMMLYEKGLFNLNEPISKYIPEFKDTKVLIEDSSAPEGYKLVPPKREITIRDLLAHTSGISYAFWGRPFIAEWYLNAGVVDILYSPSGTIADNIKKLATCPLLFHPGERLEYGHNTDVLGYFVEIVSGMRLDKFFKERIFDPLGMNDTHFFLPSEKVSRLAAVYEPDGKGGLHKIEKKVARPSILNPEIKTDIFDPSYPYKGPRTYFSGGGGLCSTALDYMRFCQMILNKGELDGVRLLSPLTVELMTRNHAGNVDTFLLDFIAGKGWQIAMGGAVLVDRDQVGHIIPNGTFCWGGYFSTNFDIDFQNNMIYMLNTQRKSRTDPVEEFNKLRVLSHAAIIED